MTQDDEQGRVGRSVGPEAGRSDGPEVEATDGPGARAAAGHEPAVQGGDDQDERRRRVRRAAAMLAATGLAIVGLVLLVVGWLTVASHTLAATKDHSVPCLVAVNDDAPHSKVRYDVLPARSVCTWQDGDEVRSVVIAQASGTLTTVAVTFAVVGVAGTLALVLTGRRRR
ncbi:hypothetical protein [Cellulomonas sp. HZM]|uniref:hypothetical protein n=1 Tax=Cellulomonas sp. HZM TaxID=1454010 RepID=UPI0004939896|nr:hypothetical protein [Cellulomonas sp. HZM]